jgi:nucleotide-binding universal stress UspA family protein
MRHIIVPVDLSRNSREALNYASHIARAAGVGITVVFGYNLLEKAIRYTTKKGEIDKDPDKWIQKRILKIQSKRPELKIQYKIIKGDILDSIKRLVDVHSADLVIMGCQGKDENRETFLGTTAGAMVKTTNIPVILVPPRFKFKGINKVVFAVKNTSVRYMGTLEPIISIKQLFKPQVQMLHLGGEPDTIPEQSFSILQLINDITRYGNDNFNESIHEYLEQHHADLICVIRRKRGFLEKTLGPTRTPASKFSTDVPMLVLVGEEY